MESSDRCLMLTQASLVFSLLNDKHEEVSGSFERLDIPQICTIIDLATHIHWLPVLHPYIRGIVSRIHNNYNRMSGIELAAAARVANHFGDKDTLMFVINELATRSTLDKEGNITVITREGPLYWNDQDSLVSLESFLTDDHGGISLSSWYLSCQNFEIGTYILTNPVDTRGHPYHAESLLLPYIRQVLQGCKALSGKDT
ncbi:hypothetical protein QBC36DRAFT_316565 [Triangularia setosa]|uniref:Uncharacterized protein n=1 Tax=Triangularia setosa TaxID=2587417 RepID=A0AAN6VXZ8_9PEZI|nr:hypothetical protein QBC36DRAFT_316565 [Podospora setosa]